MRWVKSEECLSNLYNLILYPCAIHFAEITKKAKGILASWKKIKKEAASIPATSKSDSRRKTKRPLMSDPNTAPKKRSKLAAKPAPNWQPVRLLKSTTPVGKKSTASANKPGSKSTTKPTTTTAPQQAKPRTSVSPSKATKKAIASGVKSTRIPKSSDSTTGVVKGKIDVATTKPLEHPSVASITEKNPPLVQR